MEAPHERVEDHTIGSLYLVTYRLHLLGALLLFLLAILITYDVLVRALFNAPFAPTTELARNGVVIIAFLQLPHTIAARTLLKVTILQERASPVLRMCLEILGYVTGLVIFGALVLYSWPEMVEAFHTGAYEGSEAFRMPIGPIRLTAIILWAFAALTLVQLIREALVRHGGKE
jgi:TRAP-type C4-dicarboxylate transport system permease small subunit